MAGGAAFAGDGLDPVHQSPLFPGPFLVPGAIQRDQVKVHGRQFRVQAECPLDIHRLPAVIHDLHASGDDIQPAEDCIVKDRLCSRGAVFRKDLQRIGFLIAVQVNVRKRGKIRFPGIDPVAHIADVRC